MASAAIVASPAPKIAIPKEFEDAPAVVLEETQDWQLERSRIINTVKRRVLMLTREGFDEADQAVGYLTELTRLDKFEARTILPDGRVVPIPDDLMKESVLYKRGDFDYRLLQFTFPAVEVGAIIEYQYELSHSRKKKWTTQWWIVQEDIPVLESRFIVRSTVEPVSAVPYSRMDYSEWCDVEPVFKSYVKKRAESVCRNVPAFERESYAPPTDDIRLDILVDWDEDVNWPLYKGMAAWRNQTYRKRIEEFTRLRTKSRALAKKLNAEGGSTHAKIDRIYRYVKENIEVRPGSSSGTLAGVEGEPKNVDAVLAAGGGASNEVTMLAMAMLRTTGVRVNPVFSCDMGDRRFVYEMPDIGQFGHLILEVVAGSKTSFMDPACDYCQAGIPDWRHCGGKESALRITREWLPELVDLPPMPALFNAEQRKETISLSADGSAIVKGTIVWQGHEDVRMRRKWDGMTEAGRRDDFIENMGGDLEEITVTTTDPERMDENMRVDYGYTRRDMGLVSGNRLLLRRPDFISSRLRVPFQEKRWSPLWRPYSQVVRHEISYEVPEGFTPEPLPPPTVLEGPGFNYKARWWSGEENAGESATREIKWIGQLIAEQLIIDAADYSKSRDFAFALRRDLRTGLLLTRETEVEKVKP